MQVQDQIVNNPTYMIVGEAPGETEEREGKPFVGKSGELLTKLLAKVGIDREECDITNVISKRPSGNNFGIFYKDKKRTEPTEELLEAYRVLKYKITSIKPKMVIGFGGEALKALTGHGGIESWRGSIFKINSHTKSICTFHPSALMRGGGRGHWYLPATLMDLNKVVEESKNPNGPHEPKVEVVADADILDEWFKTAGTEGEYGRIFSFDIETTMQGGNNIVCIGFASSPNVAVVVPFINLPKYADSLELQEVIKKWMTSTEIKWIAQNGYGFDINYIRNCWGWTVNNYFFDTMVGNHVLNPELPHNLGALTSFYTRIAYYKHWINTEDTKTFLKYNGYDAVSTWIIAQKEIQKLKERGLWELYRDYYHPLLTGLREMNWRGIKIDKEYQKTLKKELTQEAKEIQKELNTFYRKHTTTSHDNINLKRLKRLKEGGRKTIKFPNKKKGKMTRKRVVSFIKQIEKAIEKKEVINVRSNKQMPEFLYDILNLPTYRGKRTTDETTINRLYIKTSHEFLMKIISLRRAENMLSKYGKMKTDSKGFVRTTYSFAETGRLKSGRYEAK